MNGEKMTKVERAECTLYSYLNARISSPYFVGVGKILSNEIVLVVYLSLDEIHEVHEELLPRDWEGFRVVVKDLLSMLS